MAPKLAESRLATLLGEVAYGGTKEAVRVLLAACWLIVITNPRPGSWAERAKVVGAALLLVLAAYLFALRIAAHAYEADEDEHDPHRPDLALHLSNLPHRAFVFVPPAPSASDAP